MIDWKRQRLIRSKIIKYESELEKLYLERRDGMLSMVSEGMTQRDIGAFWGIKNPRVTQILKAFRDSEKNHERPST